MSDTDHYLAQALEFSQLAQEALSADEREGYLRVAGGFARLAKDAATFEARYGIRRLDDG
jgi:hypothetical protein